MVALLLSAAVLGLPGPARAQLKAGPGDWPGWRGPDRTGVSPETGLLKEWPADGPKLLWKATGLGGGYSTPALAGGRIFVLGSRAGDEYAIALDATDGKQVWSTRIGAVGRDGPPSYPGPRSTPTVDGDRLYALGSDGDLACLDTAAGKIVWHKNLGKDLEGNRGFWAYAESPLIDGDVLVCTPGGSKATLAALNKRTGDVIWKAVVPQGDQAAYASAIVAEVGGVKQYVQFLNGGVVGVAARDGKFLWRYDQVAIPGPRSTNCPTPIFHDQCVLNVGGGRGGGAGLVRLTADGQGVSAKEVYFNRELANHHGGVVRVGDYVYGTTNTMLLCLDFKTGEKKWEDRSVGKGSIAAADGHLYVRSERGPIALVEATPAGYKEKGRFTPPDRSGRNTWPHPVIAGGRLYLRDQDVLHCYDVKAP
jgi:outer membrane protein assembly factor BamB